MSSVVEGLANCLERWPRGHECGPVGGGLPFLSNVSLAVYAQAVHQDRYRANKEETLLDVTALAAVDPVIRPKGLRVLVPAGTTPGYVPVGEAVAASILDLANLGGDPD